MKAEVRLESRHCETGAGVPSSTVPAVPHTRPSLCIFEVVQGMAVHPPGSLGPYLLFVTFPPCYSPSQTHTLPSAMICRMSESRVVSVRSFPSAQTSAGRANSPTGHLGHRPCQGTRGPSMECRRESVTLQFFLAGGSDSRILEKHNPVRCLFPPVDAAKTRRLCLPSVCPSFPC